MPGLLPTTSRAVRARRDGRIAEAVEIADAESLRFAIGGPDDVAAEDGERRAPSPADWFEWGLCYEFAGLESTSLGTFLTAYNLAVVAGDDQIAFEVAGELAWLHALCGRGRDADLWLDRSGSRAGIPDIAPRHRVDLLAAAVRASDAMRPDRALELIAARPTGPDDEHRLIALAQAAIFRLGVGAPPDALLVELAQAEAAEPELVGYGENLVVLGYAVSLFELVAGRPAQALARLDRVAEHGGEPYVIGLRALMQLAAGRIEAAVQDANTALAYYHQWPRVVVPAELVKAVYFAETSDPEGAIGAFGVACRIADEHAIASALLNMPHATIARLAALHGEAELPESVRALLAHPEWFASPTLVE